MILCICPIKLYISYKYIYIYIYILCCAEKIATEKIAAQAGTSRSRRKPRTHHKPHKQFRRANALRSGLCTISRPAISHRLMAHKPPHKPKQNQGNSQENHSAQANTGLMAHKPAAQAAAISRTRPMAHKARLRRTRQFFSAQHSIYIYIYIYL